MHKQKNWCLKKCVPGIFLRVTIDQIGYIVVKILPNMIMLYDALYLSTIWTMGWELCIPTEWKTGIHCLQLRNGKASSSWLVLICEEVSSINESPRDRICQGKKGQITRPVSGAKASRMAGIEAAVRESTSRTFSTSWQCIRWYR